MNKGNLKWKVFKRVIQEHLYLKVKNILSGLFPSRKLNKIKIMNDVFYYTYCNYLFCLKIYFLASYEMTDHYSQFVV